MNTSRRSFLTTLASAAATSAIARDWTGQIPERYPDPDVIAIEPAFGKYIQGNAPLRRLHTGLLWAEGPAWNGAGNYLVWSDIPNNAQMRYLPEDGHVSVMRTNSNNSNGNTFDWQGRQISCEHGTRRIARYELNGKITILASEFEGKPFNAPNDVVVHPDGGVWFTDPGYGSMGDYEGHKGELQLKEAVYRIDPSGKVEKVTDDQDKPNGLCFSPDYKKMYIVDTGAAKNIRIYDVVDEVKLAKGRDFVIMNQKIEQLLQPLFNQLYRAQMELGDSEKAKPISESEALTIQRNKRESHFRVQQLEGRIQSIKNAGGSDGIRCDADGNLWATAGWAGDGYDGIHVFSPEGQRIGQIKLPETGSNLCFGGPKRNRLFMTAGQSLYSVYVNATGAHFC